jgi:hypothetical protein
MPLARVQRQRDIVFDYVVWEVRRAAGESVASEDEREALLERLNATRRNDVWRGHRWRGRQRGFGARRWRRWQGGDRGARLSILSTLSTLPRRGRRT